VEGTKTHIQHLESQKERRNLRHRLSVSSKHGRTQGEETAKEKKKNTILNKGDFLYIRKGKRGYEKNFSDVRTTAVKMTVDQTDKEGMRQKKKIISRFAEVVSWVRTEKKGYEERDGGLTCLGPQFGQQLNSKGKRKR